MRLEGLLRQRLAAALRAISARFLALSLAALAFPPGLGYRCIDKKLVVVPEEAEAVRTIFTKARRPF